MDNAELDELQRLAERLLEASAAWDRLMSGGVKGGEEFDRIGNAFAQAEDAFSAACDPETVKALIAAARPVPAGEFGEKLRELWSDAELAGTQPASSRGYWNARRNTDIAALTRTHTAVVAESERLREALGRALGLVEQQYSEDHEPGRSAIAACKAALAGASR